MEKNGKKSGDSNNLFCNLAIVEVVLVVWAIVQAVVFLIMLAVVILDVAFD